MGNIPLMSGAGPKRRSRRCNIAIYVAVFALLLQQGFLPILHFGLGAELTDPLGHVPAAAHAHHHGNGEQNAPASNDHGPCHFCRVLGAALPPPPVAELLRLAPARVAFTPAPVELPPRNRFAAAHLVRGPPAPPLAA